MNELELAAAKAAVQSAVGAALDAAALVDQLELPPPPPPPPVIPYTRTISTGWRGRDITEVLQVEIDEVAAAGGGIVQVPEGNFVIDALKSVTVRGGVRLAMAAATFLLVKANDQARYAALRAQSNSVISGGNIVGDRLDHTYTLAGGTHEWGYGVHISGDNIRVENLNVSECTGDGFAVSGTNIEIANCTSLRNRRQGMSLFRVNGVLVTDSDFSYTGALGTNLGTAPQAGVDIEPDNGVAENIRFIDCRMSNNATAGLLTWTRSGTAASVRNVSAEGCVLANNANGLNSKALSGDLTVITLKNCTISKNRGSGCRIELNAKYVIDDCIFVALNERTDFSLTGRDSRTANDIRVLTGGLAEVGLNYYQ